MKRNLLAIAIPALLVAGAANAAEIYNQNGTTLDVTGRVHAFGTHDGRSFSDATNARFGLLGSSEITKAVKAFARIEYETAFAQADETSMTKGRYAFAGLDFGKLGAISYGKNDGVLSTITDYTDTLPENGAAAGDHTLLSSRTAQVTTYTNAGLVNGLSFALQYAANTAQGDEDTDQPTARKYGLNAEYDILNTGVTVGAGYSQAIKDKGTNQQTTTRSAVAAVKYDANNIYVAALYAHGETKDGEIINGYEAVAKYSIKNITPVVGYFKHKTNKNVVKANYADVGAEYAVNKNLTAVVDYQINLEKDTKNITNVGVVYKF